MFYGSAANTIAKLAASSGLSYLRLNSAATAVEWGRRIMRKAADQTLDTTTLTNDDTFSFSIAASAVYRVRLCCRITVPTAADDWKWSWSMPASCVGHMVLEVGVASDPKVSYPGHSATAATVNMGTDTEAMVIFDAIFVNSTNAGTIQFQWAKNADAGSGATVHANSWMDIERLA